MPVPVIVDAVRSPIGRRGGALSGLKPTQLLGAIQREVINRSGIDPATIDQVVGGCVTQAGEQAHHVVRHSWLYAGLPYQVGAITIDAQCGSGQQAVGIIAAQIAAGIIDRGVACGVESMSRVPLGTAFAGADPRGADAAVEMPDQFTAAERIADRRGLTRLELEEFGLRSQHLAARAWAAGHFDREVTPIVAPVVTKEGKPTGEHQTVARDEGLRETTLEGLARLRTMQDGGKHSAGTASQISDGAAALILMDATAAEQQGLRPRARILGQCLVGADPYYTLDGPIDATSKLLDRHRIAVADIDFYEVNEAFASIPLSWTMVLKADLDRLNVNGGAIALGHPVGATGARLVTSAVHELERRDAELALVTMCCGGAMATAMLIERV